MKSKCEISTEFSVETEFRESIGQVEQNVLVPAHNVDRLSDKQVLSYTKFKLGFFDTTVAGHCTLRESTSNLQRQPP